MLQVVLMLSWLSQRAIVAADYADQPTTPTRPNAGQTGAAKAPSRHNPTVGINCEHLLGACAQIAAALLRGCPQLTILATSREPLAIGYEQVWPVPPLSLPDAAHEYPPDELAGYDAIGLFVARARAAQPGFALNSFIAAPVAEVCTRLDGIALAIELAAARVEVLTPAEIARRLDDRFAMLTHGSASRLPRHRTLRAALDWSHDLLSEPERALLRRLSVFVGGFEPETAELVCSGGEVPSSQVGELLAALVSKSLVVTAGDGRHRLLETIRAYGADRLEQAGESAALREAHARVHLAIAERAELTGAAQTAWLERLDLEHEDMRVAIEWSLSHGHTEWALRLAGSLVLFWRVRCHFSEGRELLEAVVSAGGDAPPALRANALWGAGFLAMMAGAPGEAIPLLEQALSRFQGLGDTQGSARALLIRANAGQSFDDPGVPLMLEQSIALARESRDHWCLAHALGIAGFEAIRCGRLPQARPHLEECLAVARAAQDQQSLRIGLLGRGSLAVTQGDYELAESLLEEALEVARACGDEFAAGKALEYLGELALGRGRYEPARERLEEALAAIPEVAPPGACGGALLLLGKASRALGDLPNARRCVDEAAGTSSRGPAILTALAELAADEGDVLAARNLFEQALERAHNAGARGLTASALHGLGRLAIEAEDVVRAAALHGEALALRHEIGARPEIAASIEALAAVAATGEHHADAARLLGAAHGLRTRGGHARAPWESRDHDIDVARGRRALTNERFDALLAEGAELSLDQAVARAAEAARARGQPTTGWISLTERERQVAELVADGLSNPKIGDRLFISLGTVKTHLSHIFVKLGAAGRTDVAREVWARRQKKKPIG